MATKKATYKYDNGTDWDEIMFKTTADQVVESTTKRFVSDTEKSNWNDARTKANDWNDFKTNGGTITGLVELTKGANFVSASDDDTAGIGMSRPIGSKFQSARIVPGNWNGRYGIGLMAMTDGEDISSDINTGTAFVIDNEGSISMHHKKDGVWGGVGDIGIYGNIVPKGLTLRNIGNSDERWDTVYSKSMNIQNTINFSSGSNPMVAKPVTISNKVNYYKETFINNNSNPSMFWRIEEDTLNSGTNQTGVYMLKHLSANTGIFAPFTNNTMELGSSGRKWKELHLSAVSKATNGYTKLPNGMIMQWGEFNWVISGGGTNNYTSVTLPISFPNMNTMCSASINYNIGENSGAWIEYVSVNARSNGRIGLHFNAINFHKTWSGDKTFTFRWFAIGY